MNNSTKDDQSNSPIEIIDWKQIMINILHQ